MLSGSAYNALIIVKLKKMLLLDINEQRYIADILDKILADEGNAKDVAEQVIERIDLLKKSILAKAFRGELGTNIVDEESSMELLKMILSKE